MEDIHPPHEELKRELTNKFDSSKSYIGSFIRNTIHQTDFKLLKTN
jgi:hypothetical protein